MRNRIIPIIGILCLVSLVLPQTARTYDDEPIKERVKPAIEAGVAFLRSLQMQNGAFPYQNEGTQSVENVTGSTALAAIALMECGVNTKDRQIQAAYRAIQQVASNPAFNYNYSVCLSLLFLDRLHRGEPNTHKDAGLIKDLAARIARGQAANGGWGYNYPSGAADNSNTQFAVVALWVSRKYANKPGGVIDQALSRAEKRFRSMQQADGGWGYDSDAAMSTGNHSTGSMTCAGILGIALHAGARKQQADFQGAGATGSSGSVVKQLDSDPAVARARAYIIKSFQSHLVGQSTDLSATLHEMYFFWSLERVATLYRWRKMDGVDWFEIGANYLLRKQDRRGGWSSGSMGTVCDTSFALLFLAKSNLLGEMETAFTGGEALGGGPIAKEKKVETKPVDNKEKAKALVEKLLTALPNQQGEILDALTEGRGSDYTDALADAITKLSTNVSKEAAREALANRMRRLSAKNLGEYMQENDREFRLAAAVAVRLKNDANSAASLIPLLADQDIGVSTAALDSLKAISGQDFGKSVERWSRWLDTKKP